MVDEDLRQCPFCKEAIHADAVKCKFCGSQVEPTRLDHGGTCPFCKESINPQALICKHCRSHLGPSKACSCAGHSPGTSSLPNAQSFSARLGGGPGVSSAPQCTSACFGSVLWCACPVYVPGIGWTFSVYPCGSCIDDPSINSPIFTAFARGNGPYDRKISA